MAKIINLSGIWEIKISQKIKRKKLNFSLFCTLSQMGNQVIGLMVFDIDRIRYEFTSILKKDRKFDIQLQGQIQDDQLQLEYNNPQSGIRQFGYLIADIESNDRMEGLFIGLGPETGGLISGTMKFKRVDSGKKKGDVGRKDKG